MTVKEFKPASDSGPSDPQESELGASKALSLEELARRQQAAMAKLQDTSSELYALLEKTITAVDESISQSKAMAEEVRRRATEIVSVVLADAPARAEQIISDADSEGIIQSRMAMTKVDHLIEAARSSAGRVANPDSKQLPALTGEIWAALEASIEESFQSLMQDLENLEQETTLSKGQQALEAASEAAGPETQEFERNGEPEATDETASETASEIADEIAGGVSEVHAVDVAENLNVAGDGAVDLARYQGNVNLLILLKKASDGRVIHITPDQLSRQIKNIPGGSVVNSGMQGKEYFIAAHFATPVSLHKVLAEVAEWEDFADQSDKVKEYKKRAWAKDKGLKDAVRILVTL